MASPKPRPTAERLLEATIEMLETGPLDAITTGAVAARVGISQPAVYRHYASLEALLDAAVRTISARFLAFTKESQAQLRRLGPGNLAASTEHFEKTLAHAFDHAKALGLFFRHRYSDGALGDAMREAEREMQSTIEEHMRAVAKQMGGCESHARKSCRPLAVQILAAVNATIEATLLGHLNDIRLSAKSLAMQSMALTAVYFGRSEST